MQYRRKNNSLLIISHTPHYKKEDEFYGWGATVREIDELADLFDEVMHIAPLHRGIPNSQNSAYKSKNIFYNPAIAAGGEGIKDKLQVIVSWFRNYSIISKNIGKFQYIHLRCPANISLLTLLILITKPKKHKQVWIKYAGNWGAKKIPLGYKVQKFIIKKFFKNSFVTINGSYTDTSKQFHDFLNPCLYDDELKEKGSLAKALTAPVKLVFVGSFEPYKGTDTLIKIASYLQGKIEFSLDIVGDGSERTHFLQQVNELGLEGKIEFLGWRSKEELKNIYSDAHFVLLPSKGEGWPKVLSEGMAYGAVPVSSNVSCIPQVLDELETGACFEWDDYKGFGDFILNLAQSPELWQQHAANAIKAAPLFTYTTYKRRIKELFIAQA